MNPSTTDAPSLTVCCPHCQGKGKLPLRHDLALTLEYVKAHPRCTTNDVHANVHLVGDSTMVTRRLLQLVSAGLVVRESATGVRGYLYRAK